MKTFCMYFILSFLMLIPSLGKAQLVTISGYITDYISGETIEYATVFESNSGIGTISDKNGFFKLMLVKGKSKITISETGYKNYTKVLTLNNDTTLNVQLKIVEALKSKDKEGEELQAVAKVKRKSSTGRRKFNIF